MSVACLGPEQSSVEWSVRLRRLAPRTGQTPHLEEVGEATLARSARSGLASATPGPGHQARIPNGILCSWSSSQINLGHERAAGCHRLCRRRSSGHWRVRRPGHGQADHRSGNRSPDPASWPPPPRHRRTPRDCLRRRCRTVHRPTTSGHAGESRDPRTRWTDGARRAPHRSRIRFNRGHRRDRHPRPAEPDGLPAAPRPRATRDRDLHLRRDHRGDPLSYSGELGTDFWRLGQAWGDLVARSWVDAVRDSMATIKTESERRAQR